MLLPKPEPRKRAKTRERRREWAVKMDVRAFVNDRDSYCRLYWIDAATRAEIARVFGACEGPSEWAHLWGKRRSLTMRQPAEERHTTADSIMLCRGHHQAYDAHKFEVIPTTSQRANGQLLFEHRNGKVFTEPS